MARNTRKARGEKSSAKGKEPARDDGVPQVYKEMMEEVGLNEQIFPESAIKRRRITPVRHPSQPAGVSSAYTSTKAAGMEELRNREQDLLQTVVEEESSDEDFEWEDVIQDVVEAPEERAPDVGTIELTIGGPSRPSTTPKRRVRRAATASEKKARLNQHKAHILFQLHHGAWRNHWCNDEDVQRISRKSIAFSSKIISKLHPDLTAPEFTQGKVFKEALTELSKLWRAAFSVSVPGLARASLSTNHESAEYFETFLDVQDFRQNAHTLNGSADYGAQLFCALLRGLGVVTRLVFSLQPLPFAGPGLIPLDNDDKPSWRATGPVDGVESALVSTKTSPRTPQRISRLGGRKGRTPASASSNSGVLPSSVARQARKVARPRYPVFWVEALDEANQKWIPVDPLATGTVAKPSTLEPGMNDPDNVLSYAIALEEDGTARDVTRRYAKAYNAKTRKLRVECTEYGIEWFERALRHYRRRRLLPRDLREDYDFRNKDKYEGMPRNIEDFKGHPLYVLERHLYRDQVIHPRQEIGKTAPPAGSANAAQMESVFSRKNVHHVKSAAKWYRLGRKLKDNQEPLKHVAARKKGELFEDPDGLSPEAASVGMYAWFQTEQYVPPPVVNDKIPKNAFKNIEVFERTMIPPGAIHIKSAYAERAAKILEIDYAKAVVGFKFTKRQGTAVMDGIIVSARYKDAMLAIIDGIAHAQELELEAARQARLFALLRKMVTALRIKERLDSYRTPAEVAEADDDDSVDDETYVELQDELKHRQTWEDVPQPMLALQPQVEPAIVIDSVYPIPAVHEDHTVMDQVDLFQDVEEADFVRDDVSEEGGITRDDGDEGGGFMRDDNVAISPPTKSFSNVERDEDVEQGGFFRDTDAAGIAPTDRVLIPNDSLQRLFAADEARSDSEKPGTDTMEVDMQSDNSIHQSATAKTERAVPPTAAERSEPDNEVQSRRRSQSAGALSLLSHDPEDDLMEPDWLD